MTEDREAVIPGDDRAGARAAGLSPATLELWRRYWRRRDIASRNDLLLAYDPLVRQTVGRLPSTVRAAADEDDLYSFGVFGLIDAVERFDQDVDPVRFPGYANYRIRGAIFDELRRLDWLPRTMRRRLIAYRTAVDELSSTLGRTPAHTEVCESLELDDDARRGVGRAMAETRVVSLTTDLDPTDGPGGRERAMRDAHAGPEEFLLLAERRDDLEAAIERLSERQRQVICHRYFGGMSQHQIALKLRITPARVCQLEAAGLRALRKAFRAEPFAAMWLGESAS